MYNIPWEMEQEDEHFVDYYNNKRYHEAIDNVTPANVYHNRHRDIITHREQLKQQTLKARKRYNLSQSTTQIIS